MKKILSLLTLSLVIGIGVAYAQNPRTIVLECFTSATCGPCASANPNLDNLINNNADQMIAIKYHVNWPAAGDPMNLHNPGEVSSRVSYYSVNSVPMSIADGTWSGNSASVNQNLVNQWAAVESPIEMRMTHYLNDTQDTINVIVMGRASSAIESDNLKLHIVVLEKTMTYTSAPCSYSNGERVFHNVMKKMLPNSNGTHIPAMQAGDYFAYKYSWALANVMDINELTAVAWLQNNNGKQVIQGCKSSETLEPYYNRQAKITGIDHIKKYVCSGNVSPVLYISNFGKDAINSLTFNVSINGNNLTQVTWQGNVGFGEDAKVSLGELDFGFESNNEMSFEIAQINGAADDYEPSVFNCTFEDAPVVVNKSFKLTLRTDNDPQAITWDVINTANGNVVVSGGPYSEPNKNYTENFDLDDNGCYMFTIYDAGGNGLAGGNGVYGLKAGNSTLFAGSDFTDKESNELLYYLNESVDENPINTAKVFPNPSNGIITVDTESSGNVAVYNNAGQLVFSQEIDGKTLMNLSNLGKGTYLFVLTQENGDTTKQVIVLQ